MKREFLKAMGLTDEQIDQIMAENGKDVESHKTKLTTAETERDGLKAQLAEAGVTIEGFKKLDVDGIKAAADEWKAKAENAQAEAVKQLAALKFEYALDGALTGAKAKNAKAVKALLDMNNLKLNETDGSIIGLEDQLKKVKESADYLFEGENKDPKLVTGGGNGKQVIQDAVVIAARRAAGLPVDGE